MEKDPRIPSLYHNAVSYLGFLIALIALLLMLFLLLANWSLSEPSPYIGIITFMVVPVFLILGGIIVLYGMRRESLRRRRTGTASAAYPRLDLNDRRQRRWFQVVLLGGSVVGLLVAFVGYNAYLFTESVSFCGEVCHTVMEPEYVAYLNGPHARVRCVECHVGHGVNWYVKSKLSGARQVIAVALDSYEKPIPTPIENLRPARETCEECHWPEKFFGAQLMQNPHFRYDRENTAEQISLLIKTGGGDQRLGDKAGIHWHMIIGNRVEFRATDRQLQEIPWMRVVHADGSENVFTDPSVELSDAQLAELPVHVMDCMDCHNRPSHVFNPPEGAVDVAMRGNEISPELPWIKKLAVDALVAPYPDREAAHQGIRQAIVGYYEKENLLAKHEERLEQAVAMVTRIWDRSVFPQMNVNWKTYPMNIGHRNWPGCFRCHDGDHVNKEGTVLTKDCTVCHTMPQRGALAPLGSTPPVSADNWHPWELAGKHESMLCSECHAAGFRPPLDCRSCHGLPADAPMMEMGCETCHTRPQFVQPLAACADCHTVSGLHVEGDHPSASCVDCHKPHGWTVTGRETCLSCHEDKKEHNAPEACAECHEFTAE